MTLDVECVIASIDVVLDADVRELDVPLVVARQGVLPGPILNLQSVAIGSAIAVATIAIELSERRVSDVPESHAAIAERLQCIERLSRLPAESTDDDEGMLALQLLVQGVVRGDQAGQVLARLERAHSENEPGLRQPFRFCRIDLRRQ